jgi:hypothetical protein
MKTKEPPVADNQHQSQIAESLRFSEAKLAFGLLELLHPAGFLGDESACFRRQPGDGKEDPDQIGAEFDQGVPGLLGELSQADMTPRHFVVIESSGYESAVAAAMSGEF